MALAATGLIYWDPLNGSNNASGYFDPSLPSAGTNYPATQAAPILSPTDLACTSGSTTVTSATGGFTAAMIGNGILIASGTNFVAGLYVVTARADTNTITVDRTPVSGGNGSSGVGYVGGRRAVWTDAFMEYTVAGLRHYVWSTGTMTLTETISISADGTAALPCHIEGRTATGAADPTGDNRPLIAAGFRPLFGTSPDYWVVQNLRGNTTDTDGLRLGAYGVINNCKVYNSSTTARRSAITVGGQCSVVDCDAQSDYGIGINVGTIGRVERCYAHDCNQGAGDSIGISAASTYGGMLVQSVVDTCTVGVYLGATYCAELYNCTLYNGTTGILATTAYSCWFVNNIIAGFTTGAAWDSAVGINRWLYNDFYDCATDRTNVAAGVGDFDADPQFTDAAGGDFSRTAVTTEDGIGITLGVG